MDFSESGYKLFCDDKLTIEKYDGNIKKYYCGRDFLVLEEGYKGETLVVVTMDANECTISKVGKDYYLLWHENSMVPRKHGKGGQSQRRFERGREDALKYWLKQVAEKVRLLSNDYKILLGGCGNTKLELLNYLSNDTKQKIISKVDVGYTNENGIWEVLSKSKENIKNCQLIEEKKLGDEFARLLGQNSKLINYGENFDKDNVKLILLCEEYKDKYPDLPIKVIRHTIVDALKICVFKRW